METRSKVRVLADRALSFFRRKSSLSGTILVLTDDAPDWLIDLCREAHDGNLPSKSVYEIINCCLHSIAKGDSWPSAVDVFPYRHIHQWLINGDYGYVNQALEQNSFETHEDLLYAAAQIQIEEVFSVIEDFLTEIQDEPWI